MFDVAVVFTFMFRSTFGVGTIVDADFPCRSSSNVCKISLSFRFRISLSDMTNYKSAFGKVSN